MAAMGTSGEVQDDPRGDAATLWSSLLGRDPESGQVVDYVGFQQVDDVVVVTLCRPDQLNALSLASWRRLAEVFEVLTGDNQLRAVVVRGAGDRAFGAGADIREFPQTRLGAARALHYNESIARALDAVAALPVPVVAMISGVAVGGGCELAAACDIRLAADGSRFGIPIGRLGVTLGYTEASAVARLIGPAMLKYLVFGGRIIDAAEALRCGLVQRVVPSKQLVAETVALVDAVRASSEVTIRAAKLVADMCGRPLTAQDTEALTRVAVEAYDGADLREGVAAFTEGRAPKFSDEGRSRSGRT